MKKIVIISVFLTMIALFSCQSKSSGSLDDKIIEQEALLFDEFEQFNQTIAEQLIQLYLQRVDSLPKDSLTPGYLFKAADISVNLSDSPRSIVLLNRFTREYPQHEQASMSLFLKAFVYENQMNDTSQARMAYEEFIYRYPQSDFVEDARIAIKNMGKSPETLIKEFEKMNGN
ncbi:MAG: tetratricopeptide repeat protein [Bacteroidales bacterium]|nr:tetratricopeptide repeat protein [Bacteroidales bacterium]